jgi:hypothetical protein
MVPCVVVAVSPDVGTRGSVVVVIDDETSGASDVEPEAQETSTSAETNVTANRRVTV